MAVIDLQASHTLFPSVPVPPSIDGSINLDNIVRDSTLNQRNNVHKAQAGALLYAPETEVPVSVHLGGARGFSDDFYNRIHIRPSRVDVGNLTSNQFVTVEVFNGYFTSKNLSNISASNASGILLTGAVPPALFGGLRSEFYQLTITTDGSPDINADFMFEWDTPLDTGHLYITGSRIVMMPYVFESPMQETLEWKTQLLKANDGTEQRIRLRKNPRQRMQVRYPLPYKDLPRAENLAYGWITRRWAVPLWSEAQQVVAGIAAGTQTFNIDTTSSDFRVGSLIAVWQSASLNITAEIQSMTPTSITLDKPINETYVLPWVAPVRIGRVLGDISRQTDGYNGALSVQFEFTDGVDFGAGAAPQQFLGNDVYLEAGIIGSERFLQDSINARIDVVDYGGVTSSFAPWKYTQIRRPYKFLLQGLDDVWRLRKWLHRRAGKIRPFWIPTFESNLRLIQTGLVTGSLTVASDDYKLFAYKRNHIAIKLADGSFMLRTVLGIADITDNRSVLTLDANLNVEARDIREVSFLGLHRIDSDRIEINWTSNRTAQVTVPIMEISP